MPSEADLFDAIKNGDAAKAESLARSIANKDALSKDGFDPVGYAIEQEFFEVAKALLKHGFNLANEKARYTAMQCALEQPAYEMIGLILEANVNLNISGTAESGTALHLLCEGYLEPKLLEKFLEKGADPRLKDSYDRTARDILEEHYDENIKHKDNADKMIQILTRAERHPPRIIKKSRWKFW